MIGAPEEIRTSDLQIRKLWNWPTPEAMILDIVTKYHQLQLAGASVDLIWIKLEAYRADYGTAALPQPCSLSAFLTHRLELEDPRHVGLGPEFLQTQVERCERFVLPHVENQSRSHGWPPAEWLTEKLTPDQLPVLKPMTMGSETRSQAILKLRAHKSRQRQYPENHKDSERQQRDDQGHAKKVSE